MTDHPGIQKVTFTGSVATGKKVAQSTASHLSRVTLELGGNDAAIVLPDVDPKQIATEIFESAFSQNGQACIAIKRLYVHEIIYDEMVDELRKLSEKVVSGEPYRTVFPAPWFCSARVAAYGGVALCNVPS